MTKKTKDKTPMEKLTEGYEKFIKGKEINKNGKSVFNNTIKKAANPKPRSLK